MKTPSKDEAAALALVPLALTADESTLLQRYRATAPHWRADIVDFANTVAKMFPQVKPTAAPAVIHLVSSDNQRGRK
ncbi:hypothetical protein [Janthinobacterium sp. 75]|uniref:hypothetical protein n=1 Tax=Janthinobacterium sp. 75 TaxID=2135628 RepID=UPI0010629E27|nr:hypothetical protein [Janthinobacterium sp. 75]TDY32913.1 hypothetical protein C8C89_0667 [Janthinobacterium sp. 75]